MERTFVFEVSARHRCNFLCMTSDLDSSPLKYLLDHPNPPNGERTILRQTAFTYWRTDFYFSMNVLPQFYYMPQKII